MSLRSRSLLLVVAILISVSAGLTSGQCATIRERIAEGAVGSVSGVPSGPLPSVATILDSVDVLAAGTLGQGRSYLSEDEKEVFTEFPLENAIVFFRKNAMTADKPGRLPGLSVTQRGGTIAIDGHSYTQKESALLPLQPGTQVLCLLNVVRGKYHIAGLGYFGVFAVEDEKLRPLVTREDFAPDYRGRPFQEGVQSMLAILHGARARNDLR